MLTVDSLSLNDCEDDGIDDSLTLGALKPLLQHATAVNLICFYYLRSKRRLLILPPWKRGGRRERRAHQMLLCQIQYYPLIKRTLSYLLTMAVRRRFQKVKRGIHLLLARWRQRLGPTNSDDDFAPPLDYLCPSPMVSFRGKPLSTPIRHRKRLEADEALTLTLRKAPLVNTPLTTRMGAARVFDEYSHDLLALDDRGSLLGTPVRTRPKLEVSTPSTTLGNVKKDPKKRPQRIIKKNSVPASNPTVSSLITSAQTQQPMEARKLSSEAELASVTISNTRANSAYQACELSIQDVIRAGERPVSPSNRFSKSLAAAQRKWTDLAKARDLTQRQWERVLSEEKSPRKRKIKWSARVSFIGGDEDNAGPSPSDPFSVTTVSRGALRDPLSRESAQGKLGEKQLVRIQRIIYIPDKTVKKGALKKTKSLQSS